MEQENLNKEQIATIAELLGQKQNATYCTMDVIAKNITAFLYVMLGRTFEGKTVNYQCVVDALKELPATAYDTFHTMVESMLKAREETKKLGNTIRTLERDATNYKKSRRDLLSLLHREKHRAIMFEHLYMKHSEMGHIIQQELSSQYSGENVYCEDGHEWSEVRTFSHRR